MQKEIKINFTSGAIVLIPDSNTSVSSFSDHAITVPTVVTESSGTSIRKFAQILEFDFASHIHDLYSAPIMITANRNSGVSTHFMICAEKRGKSEKGMSSWYITTSSLTTSNWEIRIAESVLEKSADLNQCIEALAIRASGENFKLGAEDTAIKNSIKTLKCLIKN